MTLSLHFHSFPPNPITSTSTSTAVNRRHPFFQTRVAVDTPRNTRRKPYRNPTKKPKPKPFAESDAFPSSLPLHRKNPQSIYKDIQRFARENKLREALSILDYLDQQGIPVNPTTFSSLLVACVRSKSLTYGKQVHVHIRINGLDKNEFLRRKLVHMYTSCDSVEDAQKVFDESSSRSVYSWNALLRGAVISGKRRYLDVLSTFSEMRELGIELNVYTFSNVLKSFAGASALGQGLKTHALLVKNGFIDSSILGTSLVDMYFKCGRVKLARRIFEEIHDRDVVLWGAMISGFAHNKCQQEALEFVRRMVSEGIFSNSVILTTILPIIGELGAMKVGKEVHAHVLKSNKYSSDLFIHSGLIDMYCKCKDISTARKVFYGSTKRTAVSWTALMSGYVRNGRLDQALRSIVWMQQEGFRPDIVTVATILPVCGELRDLKHGKELHAYALKKWFLPNVSIVTSLIVMYCRCGVLKYSCNLFNGLEQRNVKAWTAMINSYAEHGLLTDALDVFRSMVLTKHRPDSVAIARVLSVCCRLQDLKLGKEIHGHVLKKDFQNTPFVLAQIVKMYGNCGLIGSATLVFDSVPYKGCTAWTAIIEAFGSKGRHRDAISRFDQMIYEDITPNESTFLRVLLVCNDAGFVDEAIRIFDLMLHTYKLKASQEHFTVVTSLLTRFGRAEEARRFRQMSLPTS